MKVACIQPHVDTCNQDINQHTSCRRAVPLTDISLNSQHVVLLKYFQIRGRKINCRFFLICCIHSLKIFQFALSTLHSQSTQEPFKIDDLAILLLKITEWQKFLVSYFQTVMTWQQENVAFSEQEVLIFARAQGGCTLMLCLTNQHASYIPVMDDDCRCGWPASDLAESHRTLDCHGQGYRWQSGIVTISTSPSVCFPLKSYFLSRDLRTDAMLTAIFSQLAICFFHV